MTDFPVVAKKRVMNSRQSFEMTVLFINQHHGVIVNTSGNSPYKEFEKYQGNDNFYTHPEWNIQNQEVTDVYVNVLKQYAKETISHNQQILTELGE